MGKIAGKIFLTSQKHHSNQSPAASSRCLHWTGIIYHLICCAMIRPGTDGENRKMNKQQQTALNMAKFIKSQSLTLLEKLDALDADEQAAMCERLHELAEELQNSIQIRFETPKSS
jgi:hypothetical protein